MCVAYSKEGRKITWMKESEGWRDRESNKENNKQRKNDEGRRKNKE
jgi:hypothetical protein